MKFTFINGKALVIGIAATLFSTITVAQEVTLKATKLRGNVYMIEGVGGFAGGNVAASIGEDGILVVDSLVNGRTEQLTASLTKLAPKGKLKYLLNTHWHGDHSGGNAKLSAQVPVVAHDNVRKRLMHDQKNYFGASPAAPKEAWPVLTFSDSMTFHFNNETVELNHYPNGHTDGDSVIYFKDANVLHLGDDYFKGMYPFVDLTTGGSVLGLAKNIGKIIETMPEDVMIIPGHGALSTLAELKEYHKMLKASIKIVKKAIKDGKSLEQIQQQGLGKALAPFSKGFIPEKDWIGFTYNSIKGKKVKHAHGAGGKHHHH